MSAPPGWTPVAAIAQKKLNAAVRADERAVKLRAEADALLASKTTKKTPTTK